VQSFTAVEGADLMAKLEAAQTRARARQTPYWSAYTPGSSRRSGYSRV
jgi:hypothetical protein